MRGENYGRTVIRTGSSSTCGKKGIRFTCPQPVTIHAPCHLVASGIESVVDPFLSFSLDTERRGACVCLQPIYRHSGIFQAFCFVSPPQSFLAARFSILCSNLPSCFSGQNLILHCFVVTVAFL